MAGFVFVFMNCKGLPWHPAAGGAEICLCLLRSLPKHSRTYFLLTSVALR